MNPDWSGKYASPQAQIKACMNMMGQPGGYPRRPLLPVDSPETLAKLAEILASAGLLPVEAEKRRAGARG
jgi:4-hydroxy-tetrahydrodipicolinate synthase